MGLLQLFSAIELSMAMQLVDSSLVTTREFWRRKIGLPEEIVTDPRPLREIAAEEEARHGR